MGKFWFSYLVHNLTVFLIANENKVASTGEIGKSVNGAPIFYLKLSEPDTKKVKPKFKIVGSMHGNEVSGKDSDKFINLILICYFQNIKGRQIVEALAQYLVQNYKTKADGGRVRHLIHKTDIYLVPLLNPDGYAKSKVLK